MRTLDACPGTNQPPVVIDPERDGEHEMGLCPVCVARVIVQHDRLIPHGTLAMGDPS